MSDSFSSNIVFTATPDQDQEPMPTTLSNLVKLSTELQGITETIRAMELQRQQLMREAASLQQRIAGYDADIRGSVLRSEELRRDLRDVCLTAVNDDDL